MNKCELCKTELVCLGGHSAHPQNWYCPNKDCPSKMGQSAPSNALSKQIDGDHYKNLKIQPVEYCRANNMGGLESSVVRYITRHKLKNGRVDIEKAIHCLELILELDYAE